jgi:sigma-B regulation protein RsbU (phosphoserine phosphatase)
MHMAPSNLDLSAVIELMRNLSLQTDPQQAASLYGQGLMRFNLVPNDRYLSVSRRGLTGGAYRITRNTAWKDHPNPWKEGHKLPVLTGGILGEILYSNQLAIIKELPQRLQKDDPAYEALAGFELLIGLPHFDNGQGINYGILLNKSAAGFPFEQVPMMVWIANLWGRATLNLVNTQKLQAAYDAMDHELKIVADIQRSLLPRELPRIPGVELAAYYQTSQRAGGDYYDFFPLPEGQWGILLADVSGHGTPAAVLMAITHAIAHTHPGHPMPPHQLLQFVNAQLARHYTTDNGSFVTAIYGILDPGARRLTYSSAGHPSPRLLRKGRVICGEIQSAFPLGIHGGERFDTITLPLETGDQLLFYTDGVPDTFNDEGESFGTERLDEVIRANACESAQEVMEHVLRALEKFGGGMKVTDDRTILALSIE